MRKGRGHLQLWDRGIAAVESVEMVGSVDWDLVLHSNTI